MYESWRDHAACLDMDWDVFYPRATPGTGRPATGEGSTRRARVICADCAVREECAEFVFSFEPRTKRFGIWAGLTPSERYKIAARSRDEHRPLVEVATEEWERVRPVD